MLQDTQLNDTEFCSLIESLLDFIDEKELNKGRKSYLNALNRSSSIIREYIQWRNPLFAGLCEFENLNDSGHDLTGNLDKCPHILPLILLAKRVEVLAMNMPPSVRSKYRNNLFVYNGDFGHQHELALAFHFQKMNAKIDWYEESDTESHPEFKVQIADLDFDIECKSFQEDSARKIKRFEFYIMAEVVSNMMFERGLTGKIHLETDGALPKNIDKLKAIGREVGSISGKGEIIIEAGRVSYNLCSCGNIFVDLVQLQSEISRDSSFAKHGVVLARSRGCDSVDPVIFTCKYSKTDKVLESMYKVATKACDRQLNNNRPGLLAFFLPEISSFKGLETKSGLKNMTEKLCSKKHRKHVVGVEYTSNPIVSSFSQGQRSSSPAIYFHNDNCRYPEYNNFEDLVIPKY